MNTNSTQPKKITASLFQNHVGQYIAQANHLMSPLIVVKHGKPIAVVIGYHLWQKQKIQGINKPHPWIVACQKLAARIKKNGRPQTPAVTLIRQLRDEA